jgi:hypothetical protein
MQEVEATAAAELPGAHCLQAAALQERHQFRERGKALPFPTLFNIPENCSAQIDRVGGYSGNGT